MKRVLITGVAGFIGSHLADRLVADGYDVHGVDNFSVGRPENIEHLFDEKNFTFYRYDITDKWTMERMFAKKDFDIVIHLAALARIQPSIEEPIPAHENNLTGTLILLDLARRYAVGKFVFAGSSSIYSSDELPQKETSKKDPKSPYGMQKLMSEQYIQLFHRLYGQDFSICRFFNVYGPRQILKGAYSAVLGTFLYQKANNEPLTIFGDGSKRRDVTHVYDIVDGLVKAGEHKGPLIMNLGTGKNISIKELADMVSPNQKFYPDRPGEAKETLCDNTIARSIGWQPMIQISPKVIQEITDAM